RTLRRHFKEWLPVRSAAAYPWRYKSPRRTSPTLRRMMLAAVMRPEVRSIGAAARIAQRSLRVSESACFRVLRPSESLAVRELYRARITLLKAERIARE